jgi:hypothetical protein
MKKKFCGCACHDDKWVRGLEHETKCCDKMVGWLERVDAKDCACGHPSNTKFKHGQYECKNGKIGILSVDLK